MVLFNGDWTIRSNSISRTGLGAKKKAGPGGPPVTYGPGLDPLQGSGDPGGNTQQPNPGFSFAPATSLKYLWWKCLLLQLHSQDLQLRQLHLQVGRRLQFLQGSWMGVDRLPV